MERTLQDSSVPLKVAGAVSMDLAAAPRPPDRCNTTKDAFIAGVEATKEHIRAGDVFQLVLSQRFERSTYADPFDIYRSLRIVNPSPYMVYLQVRACEPHAWSQACRTVALACARSWLCSTCPTW
jgi:anthranilate synthase component I